MIHTMIVILDYRDVFLEYKYSLFGSMFLYFILFKPDLALTGQGSEADARPTEGR